MKKTTILSLIALLIAIVSCVLAYTDQVLVVIVVGPLAAVMAMIVLGFGWKNKTARLFCFMSIALALYAVLQFYQVNDKNEVPAVEVEEGESETDKRFEEQLEEEGFDDAFEEEEEVVE